MRRDRLPECSLAARDRDASVCKHAYRVKIRLALALFLLSLEMSAARGDSGAFPGKWIFKVRTTSATSSICWLKLWRENDRPKAEFFCHGKGMMTITSVIVASDKLQILGQEWNHNKNTSQDARYQMKLQDGKIRGSFTSADGVEQEFVGVPDKKEISVAGTWKLPILHAGRRWDYALVLRQQGEMIGGTCSGDGVSSPIWEAKTDGSHLSFGFNFRILEPPWPMAVRCDAVIDGDSIYGVLTSSAFGSLRKKTSDSTPERLRMAAPPLGVFIGRRYQFDR